MKYKKQTMAAGGIGMWAGMLALLAGAAQAAAAADSAELRAACDAAGFEQLLVAAPAMDARGHWLNRRLLLWPALTASGRFKLYHSAAGRLDARAGHQVSGFDGVVPLTPRSAALPPALAGRFGHLGPGLLLAVPESAVARLPELLRGQMLLVQEDERGQVLQATGLQAAAALDDLYARAAAVPDLGVSVVAGRRTGFKLWAPTARAVHLCHYAGAVAAAQQALPMRRDAATGIWSLSLPADLSGGYYSYLVETHVRGVGRLRNRVTDPYSLSLSADSRRSYIADLAAPALKPPGWDALQLPDRVKRNTEMVIYELHVRDFSINDASVPEAQRGKYQAFTVAGSLGMQHLRALSEAGLTDVHLLPVFDIATIPETGCAVPQVPAAAPDSEAQQAAVMALAERDCFNWGYDPLHYNAPEGSYASDAMDGARRIVELRQMVQALSRAGLRVGMDVVYNHTAAAGQHQKSVLDRIVPGYYQRYDAQGQVERSTCCDNTATEHRMMGKLMEDSVLLWAREYKMASFRFDLMGHQPRAAMERLQARLRRELGRPVQLIGEGWNFGEVADGRRFVQASQLSLNGSGIATFSDRARDALRGGGAADGGEDLIRRQGWLNGLHHAPNALGGAATREDLLRAADLVRVGLAGSLRGYQLQTFGGERRRLEQIDYAGQPAGYASAPGEVVNYADNHDNQTLFDINALKLPQQTSREDRARVQLLGMAVTAFSQGVPYFHAGIETLRSKSLDRNSYDSGDWFNRLDWSLSDNYFGTGLPPKADNGANYALLRPVLNNPLIKPEPAQIRWTRDAFLDLLRIRASSSLFRLATAAAVQQRLRFHNTGPQQNPLLLVGELDGRGLAGAGFERLIYFVNTGSTAQTLSLPDARGLAYRLHPVHLAPQAADTRPAEQAGFEPETGRFTVPARTALVYVLN
ncbi:pullulanase-type alpha-1,6-glucosidase [Paucibacter sp. O1-1]|nr:pullulanase-type alpha-1,6-glucosidase [Paucibacter sp. O1-1]MDA3824637.1 pullulanase-type alpha-1,6-glucosidase [Paucibacter sp. O1-1]